MAEPDRPTPRRRQGLPRTTGEGERPEATSSEAQTSQPESEASAEEPAAPRTRMNQQSCRTRMGQQPQSEAPPEEDSPPPQSRRRVGMGLQLQQSEVDSKPQRFGRRMGVGAQTGRAANGEQHARRAGAGDQASRRSRMGEQFGRRAGLREQARGSVPAQQEPTPTPTAVKTGGAEYTAPTPAKTQPPQKTFLNRTAKQWALIGPASVLVIIIVAGLVVVGVRWMLGSEPVADFVESYPGQYSQPEALGGFPWWLNWAHFFNAFLMVLIIKTGLQIRTETRPAAYWSPKWNKKRKISLTIWLHNGLDVLWVLNGVIFVVLLTVTGYWQRVVPTSWEVFPNAVSAALQYASLDWPTSGDWAHYNSLQELAYFTTIFIAAPLAILTGVRMSGLWSARNQTLNRIFPVEVARAVHFPVMLYFTVFILVHVILVLATDALSHLNQIYTGQDTQNWTGFWLFVLSIVVIIAGALLARPLFVAPIASLFGRVGR